MFADNSSPVVIFVLVKINITNIHVGVLFTAIRCENVM